MNTDLFFLPDGLTDLNKGDLIEIFAVEDIWLLIQIKALPNQSQNWEVPIARQLYTKHGSFDTHRMLRLYRGQCTTALILKKVTSASLLNGTASPLTSTSPFPRTVKVSESFYVLIGEEVVILDPATPGHGGYYNLDPGYRVRLIQKSAYE